MLYTIDIELMRRLASDYHGAVSDFLLKAKIDRSTWFDRLEDANFSVTQIINLCNGLHIPLHALILQENEHTKVSAYAACELFRKDDYTPIYFDYDKFKNAFGIHKLTKDTQLNSLKAIQCTGVMFRNWLNPNKRTLRMNQLFEFCRVFNANLFDYFIDENPKYINIINIGKLDECEKQHTIIRDENKKLKADNRILRSTINALQEEIERLKKEREQINHYVLKGMIAESEEIQKANIHKEQSFITGNTDESKSAIESKR